MAISHLFPEEGPTLNINFAGSRTLDPRITFTRTQTTSNGSSYMDENGLIRYAGPDEPRFDHRYVNGEVESLGLLIEEQRTNLLDYSANFNNWSKVRSYISGVNVLSPDGTETANKLVEDNSLGSHYVRVSPSMTANLVYTISVYVKSAERSSVAIYTYGSTGWSESLTAVYDLNTQDITGTNAANCTISEVGNGWYRITYTATKNSTTGTANVDFYTASGTTVSYQGDNSSGIYIWGAQLEIGSFTTSYIPTEGSTKTRNPDNVSMTGTNFTDWYNPTEGSIRLSYIFEGSNNDNTVFAINNTTQNEQIDSRWFATGTGYRVRVEGANQASYAQGDVPPIPYKKYKSSFGYKSNDFGMSINGSQTLVDNSGQIPTLASNLAQMEIGKRANTTRGNIILEQLTYYPRRLTDAQLQNLTK